MIGKSSSDQPRITIAIPTLNQASFIEQTLDSLLAQNYPGLRLIVMDGGSTDGTLEIIYRYQEHLQSWRSAPDDGPWSSILEASAQAEDGWFNWLNSDDFLLPGALSVLSELIRAAPKKRWISGARLDVDAEGRPMRAICPWLYNPSSIAFQSPFLPQDATFFRLDFFREVAPTVPSRLNCIFDTVLHRNAWQIETPLLTNSVLSAMRWHGSQLTSTPEKRLNEYLRNDVRSAMPRLSFSRRILRRLSRTRFHPEVSAFLQVMLARGCFDAGNLQACVYWPWTLEWKFCSVAEAYSSYRA